MSRRSLIRDIIEQQLAAANSGSAEPAPAPEPRAAPGPVRAVGLSLDRLDAERRALEAQLANGARVVEIDPALIEASFAADRFDGGEDAAFEALKASIAASGQEVPILVRPLPDGEGRYQAAYGHRRLRAARELGRPVRAVVRALSDEDLVVAQGLENAARLDLSFIERASFAATLVARGFDRATIMKALAVDKTELSKMLSAVAGIPPEVARAIGPAPKIGRRRWLEFAELLAGARARARVDACLSDPAFARLPSDQRFMMAADAAVSGTIDRPKAEPVALLDADGRRYATLTRRPNRIQLVFEETDSDGFARDLLNRLDALHAEYRARTARGTKSNP